jgi:prepilin-type processing-associated H-X9-DG protein
MFETSESLGFLGYLKPNGAKDLGFGPDKRENRSSWTHHWSYHPGGANFSFVDGSVKFIPYSTSRIVLEALATRQASD